MNDQFLVEGMIRPFQTKIRGLGAQWFSDIYELNIIGVRSDVTNLGFFDDKLFLIYRAPNHQWNIHSFDITTDPGKDWEKRGGQNPKGVAVLKEGQYKDCYLIGKHQGRYDALVQRGGLVTVYRDGNKDGKRQTKGLYEDTGYHGINIHHSGVVDDKDEVGRWSAGCQVFQNIDHFNFFMDICKRSREYRRKDRFTYTLI